MFLLLTKTSRPPMRTLIPVTGGYPPPSSLTIRSSSLPSSSPAGLSTGLRRSCVTISLRFSRIAPPLPAPPPLGGRPSTCLFVSLIDSPLARSSIAGRRHGGCHALAPDPVPLSREGTAQVAQPAAGALLTTVGSGAFTG